MEQFDHIKKIPQEAHQEGAPQSSQLQALQECFPQAWR